MIVTLLIRTTFFLYKRVNFDWELVREHIDNYELLIIYILELIFFVIMLNYMLL